MLRTSPTAGSPCGATRTVSTPVVLREAVSLAPTRVGGHLRRAGRPQWHDRYCALDSTAALAWAANLAALELHAPMARGRDIETPSMLVFDLDPVRPPTSTAAPRWRSTSGLCSTTWRPRVPGEDVRIEGLQLYVPLNRPHTHEHCSSFAQAVARCSRSTMVTGSRRRWPRPPDPARCSSTGARTAATRPRSLLLPASAPSPTVSTPSAGRRWRSSDGRPLSFEAGEVLLGWPRTVTCSRRAHRQADPARSQG